jgi:glycosyltransferase involved in cell wall biosynthesis
LIWVGLEEEWRDGVRGLLAAGQLGETLRFLPALSPGALALVYQGCSALLHPTPVYPWGDALRLALASGKPAVGLESALGDALVGPAAYLVRSGESEGETHRSLGAALISVVVEESLAERLSQAARQRAADWDDEAFAPALQALYQRFWR